MDFMAIWNAVKGFLVGFIVRWLLMIGGTVFASAGVTEDKLVEMIGGILAIVISLIITLFQHKKAVNQPAPTQ